MWEEMVKNETVMGLRINNYITRVIA